MKLKAFLQQADKKKIDCLCVDGFCFHCNTVFEGMDGFYHFCRCQELRPSLTGKNIKRGSRKREFDQLRQSYKQEEGFTVIELWECE